MVNGGRLAAVYNAPAQVLVDTKGLYLPYWTFLTLNFPDYTGQRHYYVTVTRVWKIRELSRSAVPDWSSKSGTVSGFVDDTLVKAVTINPLKPSEVAR
jgi:hypothetical protein